jgi:dishevelled associated activator of morphogenesis
LLQLQYPPDPEEVRSRARQLDGLQIALRTQPNSFVTRFIDLDGLDAVLDFLAALDYQTAQSSIHTALLACLKALMNNSVRKENST